MIAGYVRKVYRRHFAPGERLTGRQIREIVAIALILALSVALSLPEYLEDRRTQAAAADDGWEKAKPEAEGMDGPLLNKAARFVGHTDAMSFLVVRHGRIVCEKYFSGANRGMSYNVYSVTQSVLSALIGIAVRQGRIGGIDDPVSRYLPEYFQSVDDSRKNEITLRNLLTMTPGFAEDSGRWAAGADPVKAAVQLPLAFNPGERFQYVSSAGHLLSAVLTRATGMSTLEFARRNLFGPAGIQPTDWKKDPRGIDDGYANLYLKTREMAKIGQLYLDGGQWNGRQLIDEAWVRDSTEMQVSTEGRKGDRVGTDSTGANGAGTGDTGADGAGEDIADTGGTGADDTGTDGTKAGAAGTDGTEAGYGYGWWISSCEGRRVFSAVGEGGQYICAVPGLDLLFVVTADPGKYRPFDEKKRQELMEKYLFPAIRGDKNGG